MDAQASTAGPPPSTGEPNSRSHRGRGGRGRGGQRRGGNQARDRQRGQPSAGQDGGEPVTSDRGPQPPVSSGRAGRGRRGARNPRRGGADPGNQRTNPGTGRSFGGHLTTDAQSQADTAESGPGVDAATAAAAALSAAAPEFVPGRPVAGRKPTLAPRAAVTRTESKSTASDLATRIHEDISNGQYECVICTNEVLRNSRVWSCSICWTVAHMSCVRKWYSNQMKKPDQPEGLAPKGWRCPGCNSSMTEEPTSYHCWCGKELNPQSIPGLPPHSCNQTCAKPRPTCPHPCGLVCHAGPCPPCQLMGPSLSCYCGKNISTKRCAETDYAHGFSCGEICGDLLPCGEHECRQPCHSYVTPTPSPSNLIASPDTDVRTEGCVEAAKFLYHRCVTAARSEEKSLANNEGTRWLLLIMAKSRSCPTRNSSLNSKAPLVVTGLVTGCSTVAPTNASDPVIPRMKPVRIALRRPVS